eukprot:TRINITY_DN10067_c0_g1_i1.p1 TRINITY_DN10067_c0_g1~~TRINITY_DN10067_c0_g1_i1.p1  ORF type:complete len:359 (+),score=83.35 TRINITY_DN10067_c0_g1_i1:35-1111(+)
MSGSSTSTTLDALLKSANQRAATAYNKMSLADRKKIAAEEKEKGNKLFTQGNIAGALECYEEAILLDPTQPIYFGNACQCLIKLKKFKEVIHYADEALELDPKFVKALMRRATAKFELKNFEGAIQDLRAALEIEPNNSALKTDLDAAIAAFNEMKAKQQLEERKRNAARTAPASLAEQKPLSNSIKEVELPEPEIKSALPVEAKPAAKKVAAAKMTTPVEEPPKLDIKVPTTAPKSFYLFEQAYATMGGRTDLLAQYFDLIKPEFLPQLFKESLSGEIISSYVDVISEVYYARGEIEKGVLILEQLSKVSRFDLVKMFLSSTQAEDVQKVLRKLKTSDKADDALKSRIAALETAWMS